MSKQPMPVDPNDGEQNPTNTIKEERKPRCSSGQRDSSNWHEETVDETTLLFRDPCSWCFPDNGEPEIGDKVVRSRGQYSGDAIHLPGDVYAERHGEGGTETDE